MTEYKMVDAIQDRKLVIYYRVSTKKQGESGLGLEGQDLMVEQFIRVYGGTVIKEFKEVETSTKSTAANRPELQKAIACAKRSKAMLVIAKLNRLARNVQFTATLMNSSVEFVCCDNPHATRFTIHIMAAVAEEEARSISVNTKGALHAYVVNERLSKRLQKLYPDGVPADVAERYAGKLGAANPDCKRLTYEHALKGTARAATVRAAQAREAYTDILPFVVELRAEGLSLAKIAEKLNEEGHTTRRGAPWNQMQVSRVLAMAS